MSQTVLAWATALIVVLLMGWMIAFGVILRRRGVNPNAVAERNTNWVQRFLIGGAGFLDLYFILRAPFPVLDEIVAARPSPAPWGAVGTLLIGAVLILASQAGMGRSWRVGVPQAENHVEALVTGGLNSFSNRTKQAQASRHEVLRHRHRLLCRFDRRRRCLFRRQPWHHERQQTGERTTAS